MVTIDTTASAFVAGLVTSLHCVGMCGPLACAWATGGARDGKSSFMRDTSVYHGAKLLSYTLIGALAGTLGVLPMKWVQQGPALVLPWLMVALFLIMGLGLDRYVPKPKLLTLPMARLRLWAMRRSGAMRAGMLGLATPLIPCGPLYLMFAVAMANGSTARGAQFALAFGLGTLPLLWLAQTQMQLMQLRMKPAHVRYAQQAVALCAAVILAWRLHGTLTGEAEITCCH